MNNSKKDDSLTLEILETIDNQSDVTQRHLADRLGVALGLANSYLKRCVNKGLIKIHQAPANRYLYYLTPTGFAEKSRLTTEYLTSSFDFYRDAGQSIVDIYQQCHQQGWRRLLLCGISELAEIAYIRSRECEIEIIGTWDTKSNTTEFLGLPVLNNLKKLPAYDACLITNLDDTAIYYDELAKEIEMERILIPGILGFRRTDG